MDGNRNDNEQDHGPNQEAPGPPKRKRTQKETQKTARNLLKY